MRVSEAGFKKVQDTDPFVPHAEHPCHKAGGDGRKLQQRQDHSRRGGVDDHVFVLLLHKDVVQLVHEDEFGHARHIPEVLGLDLHLEEPEEGSEDVLVSAEEAFRFLANVRLKGIKVIADCSWLASDIDVEDVRQ